MKKHIFYFCLLFLLFLIAKTSNIYSNTLKYNILEQTSTLYPDNCVFDKSLNFNQKEFTPTDDSMKLSSKAKSTFFFLRILNFKKIIYKQLLNPPPNTGKLDVKKFNSNLIVTKEEISGINVLTIKSESSTNKHIIFLHGGAYILEASSQHKDLIETLVEKYNFIVTFIDYPLSPENNYKYTISSLLTVYLEIFEKNPDNEIFLFGDSAGGGLVLSLLKELRDKNLLQFSPDKSVLVSPWLDISMENPEIKNFENLDPVLSVEALLYSAKLYAAETDLKNPLISPIYGDLSNLGNIKIFFGTNEVFYPDCMKFIDLVKNEEGTFLSY